ATANMVRLGAAVAARDADAFAAMFADQAEIVDHATGATFGLEGMLATYRAMVQAQDLRIETEVLATLGESLGLCRGGWFASGFAGWTVDVGAFESERN